MRNLRLAVCVFLRKDALGGVPMRYVAGFCSAVLFLALTGFAQTRITVNDLSHHSFETDFPSGGNLSLHIRSAEIHIVGSHDNRLAVHIGGTEGSRSTNITAYFERSENSADLRISGGPHNNLTITVEVPKNSNLFVRIPAGEVEVKDIAGDKDIRIHAGELRIAVGNPAEYSYVAASVISGEIDAEPFGESHGGLFRSFEKSGAGKYKLVAHVGAGELTLR
jgi:hypothetical protein